MKNKKSKLNAQQEQLYIPVVMWRYLFSWITMRKVKLFTPTMSGNIYVYEDCYKQKWLAYPDFPRKRCRYNGT